MSGFYHVQTLPQISMCKRKQNSLHMFKHYTINYLCKLEFWRAENVLKIGRFEIQWLRENMDLIELQF